MKNTYTTWRGTYTLETRSGITRDAKTVFTRGQCHSLAVALHDLTQWPLYSIGGTPDSPDHILVKTPKGFVDIQGLNAEKPYYPDRPRPINRDEVFEFDYYKPCEPELATPYARMILRRYNSGKLPLGA